jgi:hypothetical protein
MSLILDGTNGLSDVDGSASTPAIRGTDTNTGIFFPAADTIAFAEGGAEVARFDSSGNLGIGTSSPLGKLSANGSITAVNYGKASLPRIVLEPVDNDAQKITPYGTGVSAEQQLAFCSGSLGAERMRIDSSGNLCIGSTTSVSTNLITAKQTNSGVNALAAWNATTSGNSGFIAFGTETSFTERGYIYYNRGAGQVQLVATSDERLKENIVDAPSVLPIIEQIQVRQYDWKETGNTNIGFVAQELNNVVPKAVSVGEDNEDGSIKRAWGVDNSNLVPYLVKAIQEQQAIITDLKSRIEALEAK